ncbi:MAG: hypothetical protein U1E39_11465 [Planctomycetota bacterium]
MTLVPSAPRVAVAGPADGLPAAHGDSCAALDVVAPGWVEVAPRSGAAPAKSPRLTLRGPRVGAAPAPARRDRRRAPAGAARERPPSPYGDDLDVASIDLVYARDVPASAPWPLVRVRARPAGATVVDVWFDPLAGTPPVADTAAWPILLENVVTAAVGAPAPGGVRVVGLRPPDATRRRDRQDLDDGALARAAPDRPPVERPLRAPLFALAVVSWGVLWGRGGRRRVA